MAGVKVGIITDWARAGRGNAWPLLLKEIDPEFQITNYAIADLISAPVAGQVGLQSISGEDVLVVNWDAANGDAEFGAHLCQRWLEHRRPEVIHWVRRGGLLLIESQTILSVPSAPAYEAIVGAGELPTSGPADRSRPLQKRRAGVSCRKTKHFPGDRGFVQVDDVLSANGRYKIENFPATTTGFLKAALKEMPPSPIVWRGWFRRTLPLTRCFPWISLLETEGSWLRRHSVLQVARVGEGAIFASTMLLATTRQTNLVRAILQCANRQTDHLPKPIAILDQVKNGVALTLGVVGGTVAGLIAGQTDTLVQPLSRHVAALGIVQPKDVIRVLLVPLGIGAVDLTYRFVKLTYRTVRDFVGY